MIARTRGFEGQTGDFVARKHGPLYRNACCELDTTLRREESVKWTLRNLHKLFKARLMQKMHGSTSTYVTCFRVEAILIEWLTRNEQ
jgi:hypothetical protein